MFTTILKYLEKSQVFLWIALVMHQYIALV